jgi:hypothetical protein
LTLVQGNITFDQASAMALGPKLPTNTSFSQAAKLMSAAPIEIITSASPADIASNLASVDFYNIGKARQSLLASKVSIYF